MEPIVVKSFTFKLRPLAVLDSIDLLSDVMVIFPSMIAASNKADEGDMLGALASVGKIFAKMRPLVEAFSAVCTVEKPPEANIQIPVTAALKTILLRQHLVLMQWLVQCVRAEYADFLEQAFQNQKQQESEQASSSPKVPEATGG